MRRRRGTSPAGWADFIAVTVAYLGLVLHFAEDYLGLAVAAEVGVLMFMANDR